MRRRVLIIEDEPEIAHLVELHLRELGCDVDLAHTGGKGLRLGTGGYDLIVLDLMLPDMDGLEVCRRIRATAAYPPILMLTARSSTLDRVLGLELGADDYLAKPFSIRELVARVKAIFRRVEAVESGRHAASARSLGVGELEIDVDKRSVRVAGRKVALTVKEFDLLSELARHPGRVYTRSELLDRVWGYRHQGYEHTVNSHINRLRSKIEPEPGRPRYVLTVWGVGYRFAEPPTEEG